MVCADRRNDGMPDRARFGHIEQHTSHRRRGRRDIVVLVALLPRFPTWILGLCHAPNARDRLRVFSPQGRVSLLLGVSVRPERNSLSVKARSRHVRARAVENEPQIRGEADFRISSGWSSQPWRARRAAGLRGAELIFACRDNGYGRTRSSAGIFHACEIAWIMGTVRARRRARISDARDRADEPSRGRAYGLGGRGLTLLPLFAGEGGAKRRMREVE